MNATPSTPNTVAVSTPSDLEIRVTRRFDAPRRLVFQAHLTPELVRRWMIGYDGYKLLRCDIDARAGGTFRYEMGKEGNPDVMGWGGTFREVSPHERIVHTELFDQDWTGGEVLVTSVFRELPGNKSELEMTMLYVSQEARDGAAATGMTDGMEFAYGHLDALLADLGAAA